MERLHDFHTFRSVDNIDLFFPCFGLCIFSFVELIFPYFVRDYHKINKDKRNENNKDKFNKLNKDKFNKLYSDKMSDELFNLKR